MAQTDRYPFERLLAEFEQIVRSAQRTLLQQIEAAIRSGDLQTAHFRQQQLQNVQQTISELTATANPLAAHAVAEAWQQGADRALREIHQLDVTVTERTPGTFAGVSREAVEAMQQSLMTALDSAQQNLGRRVADIYAKEQRRAALRAILGASGSPDAASKDLQQRLMRDRHVRNAVAEGKGAFVDSAGRQWSLETYSNMAVRTVTREAVVQGAITRMAAHGITLARVSTHPGSCELCAQYQGNLVDIGEAGITEWHGQAVSDASAIPPYHPNCAHTLMPFVGSIEQLLEAEEQVEAFA